MPALPPGPPKVRRRQPTTVSRSLWMTRNAKVSRAQVPGYSVAVDRRPLWRRGNASNEDHFEFTGLGRLRCGRLGGDSNRCASARHAGAARHGHDTDHTRSQQALSALPPLVLVASWTPPLQYNLPSQVAPGAPCRVRRSGARLACVALFVTQLTFHCQSVVEPIREPAGALCTVASKLMAQSTA